MTKIFENSISFQCLFKNNLIKIEYLFLEINEKIWIQEYIFANCRLIHFIRSGFFLKFLLIM